MRGETLISVENVGIRYARSRSVFRKDEGYWALQDVNFALGRGQSVGIVGRNGVGKSTLLRAIAGIIQPDQGRIINYGASVGLLALNVGFINQLTGYENAILSAMLLGMSRKQIESKMDEVIEFSGIGDFIHDPIGLYSTGMVTRLSFAVALQVHTDILLIDEVLSVGDLEFQAKSAAALEKIILSDRSAVIVSHDPNALRRLCDKILWIENGKTMMFGPTEQVAEAYLQAMVPAAA